MLEAFLDILLDTLLDTVRALPFLLAVYLLIGWIESRTDAVKAIARLPSRLGIAVGALAGCIPQCGFSAAAASLYNGGYIGAATLIAVFLATSDEAIPVLLADLDSTGVIVLLIAVKLAIAIGSGLVLKATVFRREEIAVSGQEEGIAHAAMEAEAHSCGCGCGHGGHSIWKEAIFRTLKIAAFLAVTLLLINGGFALIGEERLSRLLLSGHILQPLLCTVLGMIPSCASSVLLTELYLSGGITFGSAVAGLSAGAGFGYLVLLRGSGRKRALKVMLWTFVPALICGTAIHLLNLWL